MGQGLPVVDEGGEGGGRCVGEPSCGRGCPNS